MVEDDEYIQLWIHYIKNYWPSRYILDVLLRLKSNQTNSFSAETPKFGLIGVNPI